MRTLAFVAVLTGAVLGAVLVFLFFEDIDSAFAAIGKDA